MRDLPKLMLGACVVGLWIMSILSMAALFGVLMASSINGGILW